MLPRSVNFHCKIRFGLLDCGKRVFVRRNYTSCTQQGEIFRLLRLLMKFFSRRNENMGSLRGENVKELVNGLIDSGLGNKSSL